MKKSPLSTPVDQRGNSYRGRIRTRGYSYNQRRSNDNLSQSPNYQYGNDMIPLGTSSPIYSHHSRGNWHESRNTHNRRFSDNSGFYNKSPQNQQQNYKQNNQPSWYRNMPISDFLDLRSMCENPWENLERELDENSAINDSNDSSVQIIYDQNDFSNSSVASLSGQSTINLSSSYDNDNDGSSAL